MIADQEKEKDIGGEKFIKNKRSRSKSRSLGKHSRRKPRADDKKEKILVNDSTSDNKNFQNNNHGNNNTSTNNLNGIINN